MGNSLCCVGGENDVSSAITEKALWRQHMYAATIYLYKNVVVPFWYPTVYIFFNILFPPKYIKKPSNIQG